MHTMHTDTSKFTHLIPYRFITHTHMQPWIGNSNSTIIIATVADDVADDVAATTASATATAIAIANMYRHFWHIVHI